MALKAKSLFLYNYQITPLNASIDFRNVAAGPVIQATLNLGYYSLTSLLNEIVRAMQFVDSAYTYTATADRTFASGTQNRVTISTNGTHLELLFGSGPRSASSVATLIGFNPTDQTGATTYTGTSTSGTIMIPNMVGYNYLGPEMMHKVFGARNVSASGVKESIVFSIQQFITIQFKYEPYANIISNWLPFSDWAIQQRLFDFTPDITNPTTFYEVTLDKTGADGNGMAQNYKEMLPDFPNLYDVGTLTMRINED